MGDGTLAGGVIVLIALIIVAPLIIYHVLVFPNVEGFFSDLDFYDEDEQSQHYLYWFWFWTVAFSGGIVVGSKVNIS